MSAEARAIADRIHAACNDSGFLGMGGTDEDALLAALSEARQKGLMREVEALYAQAHPGEPRLREELEDELSGDDLKRALALYDEGMRQPPRPAPQHSPQPDQSSPNPGTAGSSSPFNPVHGTLTPNTRKVSLTWEEFLRKYGMSDLFPPLVPAFTGAAPGATGPGAGPGSGSGAAPGTGSSTPGGSASPGGSSPSLPSLPDFGKLLTWEADAGKLHVRIQIPKEASLKYPIHFMQYSTLECELKLAAADSGKASATIKLVGSPDFTATASIGVSNLKDPTLFAGLVFESTRSTHFEPNPEALKKTITDTYAELVKLHDEYQKLQGGSGASNGSSGGAPSHPPGDPLDKYKKQGEVLGKMAGKIADMYQAFDKSRGTNGPEKGPNWNVSLGVNVKLDKSAGKPAEDKADTIDLTFKAVF